MKGIKNYLVFLVILVFISCGTTSKDPPKELDSEFFTRVRADWTKEDLMYVVNSHKPILTEIYEYFLKKYPKSEFQGAVEINLEVLPQGKVKEKSVEVKSAQLERFKPFIIRIQADIEMWRFAPVNTTQSKKLKFRLVFEPKQE